MAACSPLWGAGCAQRPIDPGPPVLVPCPKPPAPVLVMLDPAEYVASPANVDRLMKNVSALRAYAEGLEAEVGCYEGQVSTTGKK